MWEVEYRGFIIKYQQRHDWTAVICYPGEGGAISDGTITATAEEGRGILMNRVYQRVDLEVLRRAKASRRTPK